jgi:hypothetical protein
MAVKEEMLKAINLEIDTNPPTGVDITQLKSLVDSLTSIVTDRKNRDRGEKELVRQYIANIKLICKE